jgi:hypothetical protein
MHSGLHHAGESPYASHGLLPGALDEDKAEERQLGIEAGYAWWDAVELIVFYTDYGWSSGMIYALERCQDLNKPYEERCLDADNQNR